MQDRHLCWPPYFFCKIDIYVGPPYKFVGTNHQDLTGSCSCELSTISFDFSLSSAVRKISVDLPDIIILGCSVTITNGAKIYIRFVVCGATAR